MSRLTCPESSGRHSRTLLLLLLLQLVTPLGVEASPNIVLITADTLRADHLQSYGYFRQTSPTLDALAEQGLVFETVYVTMSSTLASHTSIMTSSYPVRHGILSNLRFYHQPVHTGSEFRTAAQVLEANGYTTAAFVSATPLSEASGIGAGFATFEGPPPYSGEGKQVEVSAADTTDRALAWLETAPSPFFLWLHYFDPHNPYEPPGPHLAPFRKEGPLLGMLREIGTPVPHWQVLASMWNAYDGEIHYMDAQIGRVLDALRARGLYDDALVLFTADHGEGLGQHGHLQHGLVWNEQTRAPLIYKWPAGSDAPTGRRSELASSIDIFPTAFGALGVAAPAGKWDGIDLLRESRPFALAQRDGRDLPDWPGFLYALATPEWTFHYYTDAPDQLYRLSDDPHQRRNVIDDHPEVAKRMREQLLGVIAANRARTPLEVKSELPDGLIEQLRKLGYVE